MKYKNEIILKENDMLNILKDKQRVSKAYYVVYCYDDEIYQSCNIENCIKKIKQDITMMKKENIDISYNDYYITLEIYSDKDKKRYIYYYDKGSDE